MDKQYLVDLVFWFLLGIDISLFLFCSNILYVMAFIDCIHLSNFKRLRCVVFFCVVCYYIYRHWTKVYIYNKMVKERVCINSSLWESEHLLILVSYLVYKVFCLMWLVLPNGARQRRFVLWIWGMSLVSSVVIIYYKR